MAWRVGLLLQHHGAYGVFDEGSVRQAQRGGRGQRLVNGNVFLLLRS